MEVDRQQFQRQLQQVGALAHMQPEPFGVFGPHSTSWQLGREAFVMLGGGRAALLQLAHPFVAQAVAQHSVVMESVQARFQNTFLQIFELIFGPRSKALRTAAVVRSIHERVEGQLQDHLQAPYHNGQRYFANHEQAMLWVGATLWETTVRVHERLHGPLPQHQKERFYEENKRFAALFGIREQAMPDSWARFTDYFQDTLHSATLQVGQTARNIAAHLQQPPRRAAIPAYRILTAWTAALLPEHLRQAFSLRYGLRQRALFHGSRKGLAAMLPTLPAQLRFFPAYLDARRRLDHKPGPDPVGAWLQRVILAGLETA